jgi:polygalacturonase
MSSIGNRNIFNQRRRVFMQAASAAGVSLAGGLAGTLLADNAAADTEQIGDPWQQAQDIIDRLARPPSFRDQDFLVTEYGAASCALVTVTAWVTNEDQAQLKTPAPGSTDCYPAITAAIAACHKAGGGRVVIPAGNWYCAGPIVLLSNVHVHLKAGAQVYFSNNPADFAKYGPYDCGKNGKLTLTRWQGNDCLNFSSLVYAHGQDNIALTGEDWTSILNGQGGVPFTHEGSAANGRDCWWTWKGRLVNHPQPSGTPQIYLKGQPSETSPNPLNAASLLQVAPQLGKEQAALIEGDSERWRSDFGYVPALSEAGIPAEKRIFGMGHYLRPHMLQFVSCTNVWLQGYQTTNTPFWQHNPIDCHNMLVKKVYANSLGPNNDGFDPEACNYVLIDSCAFNTGDDCIAINAGKDLDTQFGPAQNIVVQNCVMQSGHGALTLGSEMAGGVQNIFAQNLVFENVNWATNPLNIAIRLKTNLNRGGYLRNFHVRNVSIPNGVRTTPGFYSPLKGMPIAAHSVSSTAGGIITIDSDYAPNEDNVRTRPSEVSNVHISGVKVGNVAAQGGHYSCYQALVIQGQVAAEYNGSGPKPMVSPVTDITISDCDLGTPFLASQPYYLYNAKNIKLKNVTIAGKIYNTTLEAAA